MAVPTRADPQWEKSGLNENYSHYTRILPGSSRALSGQWAEWRMLSSPPFPLRKSHGATRRKTKASPCPNHPRHPGTG